MHSIVGNALNASLLGAPRSIFDLLTGDDLGSVLVSVLARVEAERSAKTIYPDRCDLFRAFRMLPCNEDENPIVKIVVIGQDPYHDGSADGMSFSCRGKIPPSLRNVYKSMQKSGMVTTIPTSADLEPLAAQGVLLLNATLTVIKGEPKSHLDIWAKYTDMLVRRIADKYPDAIFMCWGTDAKSKMHGVNVKHILTWGHPSPVSSANKSEVNPHHFIHCDHFKLANHILEDSGSIPIDYNKLLLITPTMMPSTHDYLGVDGGARKNGDPMCKCSWGICYVGESGNPAVMAGLVDGDAQSNNRGELMAMLRGMQLAANVDTRRPLVIVCDSKYVIGVITDWAKKWFADPVKHKLHEKKNIDLIQPCMTAYDTLRAKREVIVVHINSHEKPPPMGDGHQYMCWMVNDEADKINQTVL